MNFYYALHSDPGIKKETNQDSLCIKIAETLKGRILFAVVCDGMGGLEKGELASATIVNVFSRWFETDFPYSLANKDTLQDVKYRWGRMIKEQNQNIADYGRKKHIQLGSTFTAILVLEDGKYLIGHVGDSRAYRITDFSIDILTSDQTLVADKVRKGMLTPEQARRDPRRNVLLQCIGASKIVEPDFTTGQCMVNECYMLCSDGFRHVITPEEIQSTFAPSNNPDAMGMKRNIVRLTELNKQREETDNISAILIKTV